VAQNTARPGGSAIDGHTTRHRGYTNSVNDRRGIEEVFGLQVMACNLIRLSNLLTPVMAAG
jgi:hypothetical protein